MNRKKVIINIRAITTEIEITEIEIEKNRDRWNQNHVIWKKKKRANKIDKYLPIDTNYQHQEWEVYSADFYIKMIIKEYYEQLHGNKFNNVDKNGQMPFEFETHKLSKLSHEESDNWNSSVSINL